MPARLRRRIDAVQVTAVGRPADVERPQADAGVLGTLGDAVRAREVLRFDYAAPGAGSGSGHGDGPPRRAEPHHLITWGGRWYLVAWDLDRDDWRTFRADRIAPRTPNGPRFVPRELPGGDDVAAFVAGRFQGSGDGWPCRGEVILDLPASQVYPFVTDGVVEAVPAPEGTAGPERCRLVLGSWSWVGLAASLGRFDAGIEVVGPAELTEAFAVLSRRYADAASG